MAVEISHADHSTPPNPQYLALNSPTNSGRSVGVVRLRTKETQLLLLNQNVLSIESHCKVETLVYADFQTLILTSPTSGSHSVSIVRSRTKATEENMLANVCNQQSHEKETLIIIIINSIPMIAN
jgi:hypothetical protein